MRTAMLRGRRLYAAAKVAKLARGEDNRSDLVVEE